jgi:hypothetical protein
MQQNVTNLKRTSHNSKKATKSIQSDTKTKKQNAKILLGNLIMARKEGKLSITTDYYRPFSKYSITAFALALILSSAAKACNLKTRTHNGQKKR